MLDFTKLKTPTDHGQVLVVPDPVDWVRAARSNHESLGRATCPLLDSTLGQWRRRTRMEIVGRDDVMVFVIGHQPEYIHPGVWAKHIAVCRAAAALHGTAINLVVDTDAPRKTALSVPTLQDGHLGQRRIPLGEHRPGFAYERIPAPTAAGLARFERAVRGAMGERFDRSQMPTFLKALAGAAAQSGAGDWVDRLVTARRAVEATFGITLDDRRVSETWCSPLLIDMLGHAEAFAASYNRALASYRRENHVRGAQRPIPDLRVGHGPVEVPAWVFSPDGPRRRLFVESAKGTLRLFAGDSAIGVIPVEHLNSCDNGKPLCALKDILADLGHWRIRPRALTLTIWARLLLADLFIHGIGGAKYDRISDTIIADYYGIEPPHMACVSATLHLDLPHTETTPRTVRRLRHALRDLEYNPQRNLPPDADLRGLFERRDRAVREAVALRECKPRDTQARRALFTEIRKINAAALAVRPVELAGRDAALRQALDELRQDGIARGREFFFGLYDRPRLERVLEALPTVRDFRL